MQVRRCKIAAFGGWTIDVSVDASVPAEQIQEAHAMAAYAAEQANAVVALKRESERRVGLTCDVTTFDADALTAAATFHLPSVVEPRVRPATDRVDAEQELSDMRPRDDGN